MKLKLTAKSIKYLTLPPDRAEKIFWDTDIVGFGLRVRSEGGQTWIYQYRVEGERKPRKFKIGNAKKMTAATARIRAADKRAEVHGGKDPQTTKAEDRQKAAETFGALLPEYIAHKETQRDDGERRESTVYAIKLYLEKHCSSLHPMRLDKIGRPELAEVLAKIRKTGKVNHARGYAALSGFFSWAIGVKGVRSLDSNPMAKIAKPEEPEPRDRVLTKDEIKVIWDNCENDDFGRCVKLLLLTLCRRNEVGFIEHCEIDRDTSLWTIPGSRTKNHIEHYVPLVPAAIALIDQAPIREGSEHGELRQLIFGQGQGGFSGWSKSKRALDERIHKARQTAAEKAGENPDKVQPLERWTLHDLRRTGATTMANDLGVPPWIVEACLNHISTLASGKKGVAGTYNHAKHLPERKDALTKWAEYVRTITEGADIIEFPRRA
jgi:integrase